MTATPRPATAPAARDNPDVLIRLARATSSLAHSLAIQIVASASVTLAIATIPWLHDITLPGSASPAAAVPASSAATAMAPAGATASASSFDLAGVPPLVAFPMEGEERFTLSLRRPYVVLANGAWSDDADLGAGRQAALPVSTSQSAAAQPAPTHATRRRMPADLADLGSLSPSAPVPGPTVAVALPRERPADLGRSAMPYAAASDANDEGPLARLVSLRLPTHPPLPSPGEVSARLASQADEVWQAMARTTGWATEALGSAVPRF